MNWNNKVIISLSLLPSDVTMFYNVTSIPALNLVLCCLQLALMRAHSGVFDDRVISQRVRRGPLSVDIAR